MFNWTMDIREIRLENARQLARQADDAYPIKGLALKIGKSSALISNYIGKTPTKMIGDKIAREIEKAFSLPFGWMDSSHDIDNIISENKKEYSQTDSPSEATHVIIPKYNVKASCGDGYLNDHVEVKGGLAFMRSWLWDMGWKAADLVVIYASKDSMWPTISDGAVLLIDTSQKTPISSKVYLLNWFGEERVKRLFRESENTYRVVSDNPNKNEFPDERIDFSNNSGASLIGRVVWQGGTL